MTIHRLDFPVLARGAYGLAPPGSLDPSSREGPLWRFLNNLRPADGELRRREAIVAPTLGGGFHSPPYLDAEEQYVKLVMPLTPGADFLADDRRWLVVTSREIFVYNGSWHNMTPRYEVGTVSITNGTATLTGVSTLWVTRRISGQVAPGGGQQVELPRASGSWYEIESVDSETQITLATNFTGTTLSGANYSIRRTFIDQGIDYPVFAEVLNGDVYVAGHVSTGEHTPTGLTLTDGGVIKLAGAANRVAPAFDPAAETSFITSGQTQVEGTIDNIGYLIKPLGFSTLSDGRLVLACHWHDFATGAGGSNRVLFSSHTPDVNTWTVPPAGFDDIVDYQGSITGMARGTRYVALHFTDGVEVGQLTGEDDRPLSWNPSRASIGAVGPRALASLPQFRILGGEVFLGGDARLYRFTGDNAVPVHFGEQAHLRSDPWSTFVAPAEINELVGAWFRVNPQRGEVSLHWDEKEIRLDAETGTLSFHRYPMRLTAGAYPAAANGVVLDLGELAGYVGTDRKDSGGTDRKLIYELREGTAADSTPGFTGTIGNDEAGGDVLDFGDPSAVKVVHEIQVYARGVTASSVSMSIGVRRDGVLETVTAAASVTLSTSDERMWRFYPSQKSGQFYRLNLLPPSVARLTRMVVFYAVTGDERAS